MKKLVTIWILALASVSNAQTTNLFSSKMKTLQSIQPSFPFININGQNRVSHNTQPNVGSLSITNPEWNVIKDKSSGLPIMIEGIKTTHSFLPYSKETRALLLDEAFAAIKTALKLKEGNAEFKILQEETDAFGNHHIKFQQTKNGFDIYGAQAWLHIKPTGVITFTGRTIPTPLPQTSTSTIDKNAAENIAKADLRKKYAFAEMTAQMQKDLNFYTFVSEQIILPNESNIRSTQLAWHVSVRPDIMHHWEYFVDATTGAILNKYDHTCSVGPATATANDLKGVSTTINTFNANGTYYLLNATKSMFTGSTTSKPADGSGVIVTLDLQNTNLNNPSYTEITSNGNNTWNLVPTAVSAHNNSSLAYDYYKTKFNRNSIDGSGGDVVAFINVADDNGGGLDNAFWNDKYMFYGNGATQFKPLARGLDVGGHEMTHGVVQNTAGLEYQGESGAINESMADCFGVLIEGLNYTLGEDVVQLSAFPSGALRDMQNPHNGGNALGDPGYQPAHVNEQYTGTQDNGGVHINSGIPNKAFYLIASSITKDTAEQIYYKALSQYLTKSSKFIDLRIAVVQAATDIHGASSNEVSVIKQSFDAVGILDGTGGNYQNNLPTNPGTEGLLIVNTDVNDANSLYLTTSAATTFQALSQVPLNRKASVPDDGSYAFFVGTDNNIYAVQLTSPFTQTPITTDAYWDNVAVSKDGNRLAAVSKYVDTAIYVYNSGSSSWGKFHLYNPTTAQGVNVGGVLYADALEWDYSGENVMYDAYNKINGTGGQSLDNWDIGIIKAWDKTGNTFGDGTIFKAFSQLDEGESLGNPTFSKNSPYIISFDYINTTTSKNLILGSNLETGTVGTVFDNGQLGTPSYSPSDAKLAFGSVNTSSQPIVAVVDLAADKITGTASSATAIVNQAKWPTWFAKGTRALSIKEIEESTTFSLYPNPATDKIYLDLKNDPNLSVIICNPLGEKTESIYSSSDKSLDISNLSAGTYLLSVKTKNGTISKRFVKM